MRPYLGHGRRHTARGSDPVITDWILLTLLNGWINVGGTKPPARFCFLAELDPVTLDPKIELQLAISSGTPGSVVANLGVTFAHDHPPFAATDDTGAFKCYTVKANGDIVDGFA